MHDSPASDGPFSDRRPRREALLPSGFDLGMGSVCGSLWSIVLVLEFPRTSPLIDFLLAAIYLAAYSAFWTLASRLLRALVSCAVASRVPSAARRDLERIVAISAAALSSGVILLRDTIPSPTGRWVVAIALTAASAGLSWRWLCHTSATFEARTRWLGGIARVCALVVLAGFAWSSSGSGSSRGGTDLLDVEGPAVERAVSSRVTLIAMDGVDLRVVRRLVAENRLPAFRKLIDDGVSAQLETVSPHSPVVWTSIATGMPVDDHGVRDYTSTWLRHSAIALPVDRRDVVGRVLNRLFHFRTIGPVSSNDRKVRAIWDLLSLMNRESLVINWWATFPAEPIDGIMISNLAIPWTRFDAGELAALASAKHLVTPPRLQPAIVNLLGAFIRGRDGDANGGSSTNVVKVDYYDTRDDAVFEMLERFSSPTHALSTVYLQGVDVSSHAYTDIVFGPNVNRKRAKQVSDAKAERLWHDLVVRAYERMDARIEELMTDLDEDESLVVVSDHGWNYDGTSHWNLPPGIFLGYGKPFVPGGTLEVAHVFDVLPTLANLLDIPISRELNGKVLTAGLTAEFRAEHVALSVDSYGSRDRRVAFSRPDETLDEAHIDRLRKLGYVE